VSGAGGAWTRRKFLHATGAGILAGLVTGCDVGRRARRPNVLFVIFDDLRPELACYGNPEIKTPYFDRFASEGMLFERAFCQEAACAPSRASVMTGLRPDTERVWTLADKFRETVPDVVTMPQYFHRFGYRTISMGKIFHNHMPDSVSWDEPDLRPADFDTPELYDRDPESFYYDEEDNRKLAEKRQERLAKNPHAYAGGWAYGMCTEESVGPDAKFYDGAQADLAISKLQTMARWDEPFYLALGFFRPHIPFVAPKKYWDLYDRDSLSLAPNPYLPKDAPVMAPDSNYELKGCIDFEDVGHPAVYHMSEERARLLKHGYYASVSYADACFGKVMDALDGLGLADDTIVVVWGDHGYKLGEHNGWTKQTNWNIDTRVPLMVRVPGMRMQAHSCDRLVELVDLYPTLCDLAGLRVPDIMEGVSFKPLLEDPGREWKSAVFSQYERRPGITPDHGWYMGYSMVTERYHYVEWRDWDEKTKTAGRLAATELYDNSTDPQENENIAGHPENAELVARLAKQLHDGWRAAEPAGLTRTYRPFRGPAPDSSVPSFPGREPDVS